MDRLRRIITRNPLPRIIKKDLQLLLRSRSLSLVIVLGPLLLILMVGLAFNQAGHYKIRVGFHCPDYTNLSDRILTSLEQAEYYVELYDTNTTCIEAVRSGDSNVCLLFNEFGMNKSVNNQLDIYVDRSETNLAWVVTDTISSHVGQVSSNITKDITQQLLGKISTARETADQQKDILHRLKGDNEDLDTLITDSREALGRQELNIDEERLTTGEVENHTESSGENLDHMKTEVIDNLNSLHTTIMEINLTDAEKDTIDTMIDDIIQAAKDDHGNVQEQISAISTATDDLADYMDTLSNNLEEARRIRSHEKKQLKKAMDTLEDNTNRLRELGSTISKLRETLTFGIDRSDRIADPIDTNVESIVSNRNHFNYMLPTLVMLFVMLIGMLLPSTFIIMEKRSEAFMRNFITPTPSAYFIIARFCTNFAIILGQLAIIFTATYLVLDFPFRNPLSVLLVVVLATALFVLIGISIGYVFHSNEAATLASTSAASILLLLSGIILPLESMHEYIMILAQYNPLVICTQMLKRVLLFDYSFPQIQGDLLLISLYALFFLFIVVLLQLRLKGSYLPFINITRRKREKI